MPPRSHPKRPEAALATHRRESEQKSLKSVATACAAGNKVLFTKYAGYVINLASGDILEVDRVGFNYNMEVWARKGSSSDPDVRTKADFARQGARG